MGSIVETVNDAFMNDLFSHTTFNTPASGTAPKLTTRLRAKTSITLEKTRARRSVAIIQTHNPVKMHC